ncbi:MAG: DUF1501 domain-containing protein [Candidatus Eisenbacteria bacterium]|nr:DUF1501 domain-containing protein [Candidatus Eisenbacteria bacterium]
MNEMQSGVSRRQFLTQTLSYSAAGLIVPTFLRPHVAWARENPGRFAGGGGGAAFGGRILVVVNLQGGNDGLNTVIPFADPNYHAVRPNIGLGQNQVVQIGAATGLHPSLAPLAGWFEDGRMAVLQAVGYSNMDLSHFRGADIWLSGSDAQPDVRTGWLARFIEASFPDFPNQYPEAPYGIQQGDSNRLPWQGDRAEVGLVVDSPESFYSLVLGGYTGEWNDDPPNTRGGDELGFVRQLDRETFGYAAAIEAAASSGQTTVDYPSYGLGDQLRAVATLISGNLDTPLYLTSTGGFDTHTDQLPWHADALSRVAEPIAAFLQDMQNQGLLDRVLVLTISEFGRRVEENGGFGTDHGTAAPHFLLGAGVEGGIYGVNPDLTDLDWDGNLKHQHDFRSVYATILERHFGADPALVSEVLFGDFPTLGCLSGAAPQPARDGSLAAGLPSVDRLRGVSPNPIRASRGRAEVRFDLARPAPVRLELFDLSGRRLVELARAEMAAGQHSAPFDLSRLSAGTYFVRMQLPSWQRDARVVVLP